MINYEYIKKEMFALIDNEQNIIANMANISALLNYHLNDINWVGFYLVEDNNLVLGPFQGKPACIRIRSGHGVCGTALATKKAIIVPNVLEFPGHIACDSETRSEIVIPLISNNTIIALLDIDSKLFNRFDDDDLKGLSSLMTEFGYLINSN